MIDWVRMRIYLHQIVCQPACLRKAGLSAFVLVVLFLLSASVTKAEPIQVNSKLIFLAAISLINPESIYPTATTTSPHLITEQNVVIKATAVDE